MSLKMGRLEIIAITWQSARLAIAVLAERRAPRTPSGSGRLGFLALGTFRLFGQPVEIGGK
jgi:hypothetical protein